MKNKQMSLKPNKGKNEDIESFIMEAADPISSGAHNTTKEKSIVPWESPYVRKDLKKNFLLRLNEVDFVKIKYLSELKKCSMHKIIMDFLIPAVNKSIDIDK